MAGFALESSAFGDAAPIPNRYTCDGEDLSPPLRWANVPDEARSLALLVDDPDAPRRVFTHWVAWGLDPGAGGLDEGAGRAVLFVASSPSGMRRPSRLLRVAVTATPPRRHVRSAIPCR